MSYMSSGYEHKSYTPGIKVSAEMLETDVNSALSSVHTGVRSYEGMDIKGEIMKRAMEKLKAEQVEPEISSSVMSCYKVCQGKLKKCKSKSTCVDYTECSKLHGKKRIDAVLEIIPDPATDTWQVNKIPLLIEGGSYVVWDGFGVMK